MAYNLPYSTSVLEKDNKDIILPVTDKCRCCLRGGELKQAFHYDYYTELFKQILNVSLCSDSRLPQQLCPGCARAIDQAKMFRDMVTATQTRLLRALSNCDTGPTATEPILDVWVKVEERDADTDEDPGDEGSVPPPAHTESTSSNTLVVVPDVKSLLCNFTQEPNPVQNKATNENISNKAQERSIKGVVEGNLPPSESARKKRLTATTKLRNNIILILQYSSIVPFRHNSNYLSDYICYYCEHTYEKMNELAQHTESQHVGKVSDENLLTLMRSRAHKLINADISCVKCRLCFEDVKTIETLIEHLVKEHKKIYHKTGEKLHNILGFDLGTDELKCHLCNENFESFKILYSHMNGHYEAYECSTCQKKFIRLLEYRAHLKTHVIRKDKGLKCDYCGVTFTTKAGLVYHMKRHHLKVGLKHEKCSETVRYKDRKRDENVVEENSKPTAENRFTCDLCKNGKGYSSGKFLKMHKFKVHRIGDALRIKCEICDYVTHNSKRMKEHINAHYGLEKHGCDLCGKRFDKPSALRVHMRLHVNEKRYACSLCEAAFVHQIVLQMHMKKNHPDSDIKV